MPWLLKQYCSCWDMLFQIILWTMSPPIYHILYYLHKAKSFIVWQILKICYKTGSCLAWVNGINGICKSRWLYTIAFLSLKGKFFSSSQIRAITCNWNCWGNVCKQHLVFKFNFTYVEIAQESLLKSYK